MGTKVYGSHTLVDILYFFILGRFQHHVDGTVIINEVCNMEQNTFLF
jgi:hypothetical protein